MDFSWEHQSVIRRSSILEIAAFLSRVVHVYNKHSNKQKMAAQLCLFFFDNECSPYWSRTMITTSPKNYTQIKRVNNKIGPHKLCFGEKAATIASSCSETSSCMVLLFWNVFFFSLDEQRHFFVFFLLQCAHCTQQHFQMKIFNVK